MLRWSVLQCVVQNCVVMRIEAEKIYHPKTSALKTNPYRSALLQLSLKVSVSSSDAFNSIESLYNIKTSTCRASVQSRHALNVNEHTI